MKKTVILALLVCIALPIFADDAMVLPAGVFRIYAVPSYGFVNGAYDTDGKYEKYGSDEGKITAFNTGFAVEYGVTDWISAAVQWVPGWNITSSVDTTIGTSDVNINGLADLFIGAKIQVVGEKAPVKSETIRFCPAVGVKVPLGGADFEEQVKNAGKGDDVTAANIDKQTLGIGGRIYADYIFSEAFYLNLYSEFIYYPGKVEFKDTSFESYSMYALMPTHPNPDVEYGYDFTLEIEPHYLYSLSEGVQLEGSLPVTLTYAPDVSYDGETQDDTSESLITARPTVSLFLMKSPIPFPLKFKLGYSVPIVGWNTLAQNAIVFQVQAYLKFW